MPLWCYEYSVRREDARGTEIVSGVVHAFGVDAEDCRAKALGQVIQAYSMARGWGAHDLKGHEIPIIEIQAHMSRELGLSV